jgi:putative aldouronate transport system substrate-binding protein
MKTRRLLALLLVLVMSMSMVLTSCIRPPEPPAPGPGPDPTPDGPGTVVDPNEENYAAAIALAQSWGTVDYLYYKQNAYDRLMNFYKNPTSNSIKDYTLSYAPDTTLRMATGYNNAQTGLFFDAKIAGDGITLADGKTYHTGDLKPTWVAVSDRLDINFENKWRGEGSAEKEFNYWKDQLDQVDMVSGTATQLSEAGVAGKLVNLALYLDAMPNFKAYLEANPIVRLSITGNVDDGAIYFSPYFDGVDDIERMPLMRTDWVEKLLNGEGAFTADASNNLAAAAYTPYMPTSGKITVDAASKDATKVIKLTKDYDAAGNIVQVMNDALAAGTVNGVQAVNMLREYIDKAYNGYYGTNRADLFIGQDAAWDADELVALLRCVVANPQTLNGTDKVEGLFSREDANNQRRVDVFRFAGTLFGVRGLESRQDYLYVGTDGKLHDAREEKDTYVALAKMNAMVSEGLISSSFVKGEDVKSSNMLEEDKGFMHYDYNQTQTLLNQTKLQDGEKYMAVMVPIARWYDGTDPNGVYMRFTESWRSVKTDGWAISLAGVGDSKDKLDAALKLIDYAYSEEGQILMSYGPDEFIKKNENGEYVKFLFNGKWMPVIADETFAELWDKAGGNYTNYARQYLGSTLSFVKSQAFEYQCTHAVGKEGAGKISNAIGLGLIKHPELAITENPWYSIVPTTLPNTAAENDSIALLTNLSSKGKFSQSKGNNNLFLDIIAKGFVALDSEE